MPPYDFEMIDEDPWDGPAPGSALEQRLAQHRLIEQLTGTKLSPTGRKRVPQEGDVVFGPNGTVRRVGDKPKRKRLNDPPKVPSTEVVRTMSGSMEQVQDELRQALVKFATLQSLQDRFQGKQPPVGTVLRWRQSFDARSGGEMVIEGMDGRLDENRRVTFAVKAPQEYTYVAFRAPDGNWYTSSQRGASKYEWDALLKLIGDNYCEIASGWIEVPAPEKLSEEAMDPTVWAATLFGKKDAPTADPESETAPQS